MAPYKTKAAKPPRPANMPPATILTAAADGELVAIDEVVELGTCAGGGVEAVWTATLVIGAKLVGLLICFVGLTNSVEFLTPPVLASVFVLWCEVTA